MSNNIFYKKKKLIKIPSEIVDNDYRQLHYYIRSKRIENLLKINTDITNNPENLEICDTLDSLIKSIKSK